jgi:tetratricopeptide (TPR) repeat protein
MNYHGVRAKILLYFQGVTWCQSNLVYSVFVILFSVSLLSLPPLHAQQSPRSGEPEVQLAKGTILFYKEDYLSAVQEYLKGIEIDPKNIQLLLMTGRAYSKLNDYDNAVKYVSQAYELNMMRADVKKELARLYFHKHDYIQAKKLFGELLALNPEDFQPNYYLGLMFFNEENYAPAKEFFTRALEKIPSPEGYYYLGISYAKTGEKERAKESFKKVVELSPESRTAELADKELKKLERRIWYAGASAGVEYDSNVILLPDGMALPEEYAKKSDTRALLRGFAGISPISTDHLGLSLDYLLYQSLHFSLHDFNTQSHKITASFSFKNLKQSGISTIVSLTPGFNYTLWKTSLESYLQKIFLNPSISIIESNNLVTLLDYTISSLDFKIEPELTENNRDGLNNTVKIYQIIGGKKWAITPAIGFEANNAGINYDYRGFSGELKALAELFWGIKGSILSGISYRDYFRHTDGRTDTEIDLSAGLSRNFGKHFEAGVTGLFIKNNSIENYRYSREVAGFYAAGRF